MQLLPVLDETCKHGLKIYKLYYGRMYEPSSVNLLDLSNSFSSQQNLQKLKTYEFSNTDTIAI